MINAEKYKNELRTLNELKKLCISALRKDNGLFGNCSDIGCKNCVFDDDEGCGYERMKWMLSEYKEPVKLTRFEQDVLKHCLNEGWNYIVRDKNGCLNAYTSEPKKLEDFNVWHSYSKFVSLNLFKNLFTFIKWEDENPRMIKDILDNCEVVENESK